MKDGTLVPWKPNQEPDPLLVAMHNMNISKKDADKVLTEEEIIDELVKSYIKKIESEKK
jgi:hypothetical protein